MIYLEWIDARPALKRAFVLVAVLAVSTIACVQPARAWNARLAGCHVFEKHRVDGARAGFPAGSMKLVANRARAAARFRARSTLIDAGNLRRTFYDCAKRMTANGVAARLRARLRADGYALRFQCRDRRCGPPSGWRHALRLHAAPNADAFEYSLASRPGAKGWDHVAVYVTDLDRRPRVMVADMRAHYTLLVKRAYDEARTQRLYQQRVKPLVSVAFATDSAEIEHEKPLRDAVKKAGGAHSRWAIVGHADTTGGEAANGELSWRRANVVAKRLVAAGVPMHEIRMYAVGAWQPLPGGDAPVRSVATAGRRVDVFHIKSSSARHGEKKKSKQQHTTGAKSRGSVEFDG